MKLNPHMTLVALDPPRADPPRRWRCRHCGVEGLFDDVRAVACTYEYPPCDVCGQAPECAPDCAGVLAALGRDDVYVAAGLPAERNA